MCMALCKVTTCDNTTFTQDPKVYDHEDSHQSHMDHF